MEHKKLKTKIHFSRVNMQRKDARVWTAHTSQQCHQSEKIIVRHNGVTVLETVFKPDGQQPRAYLETKGHVYQENGVTVVEV